MNKPLSQFIKDFQRSEPYRAALRNIVINPDNTLTITVGHQNPEFVGQTLWDITLIAAGHLEFTGKVTLIIDPNFTPDTPNLQEHITQLVKYELPHLAGTHTLNGNPLSITLKQADKQYSFP